MAWTTYSQPNSTGVQGFDWNAALANSAHQQYVMSQKPGMMTQNPYIQRPQAPEQTLRDRVFSEYQKQLDKSNAANESRYNEIKGLYQGLLNQQSQEIPGMPAMPGAAGGSSFGSGGGATGSFGPGAGGLGLSLNKWGAGNMDGNSPLWGPQAAAMNADAVRRGMADSTKGQNDRILGNSMDLARLYTTDAQLGMQANQQAYNQAADQRDYATNAYRYNQNRRDDLTKQMAGFIESRNDVPPSIDPLLQFAQIEGQGNTDGMMMPQVQGGDGSPGFVGIGGSGYGGFANSVPMPFFSTQGGYAMPRWKQQIANRNNPLNVVGQAASAAQGIQKRKDPLTAVGQGASAA